jgi:hypothetical protein
LDFVEKIDAAKSLWEIVRYLWSLLITPLSVLILWMLIALMLWIGALQVGKARQSEANATRAFVEDGLSQQRTIVQSVVDRLGPDLAQVRETARYIVSIEETMATWRWLLDCKTAVSKFRNMLPTEPANKYRTPAEFKSAWEEAYYTLELVPAPLDRQRTKCRPVQPYSLPSPVYASDASGISLESSRNFIDAATASLRDMEWRIREIEEICRLAAMNTSSMSQRLISSV